MKKLIRNRYEVTITADECIEIFDRVTRQGWSFEAACEDESFPGGEHVINQICELYNL